jgi:predicted transposase/invertase (TIGR01784 family)
MIQDRYINPFTDFGFKKLFGSEPNKDLLLDFLNELLREEEGRIVDLNYLKLEQIGLTNHDRSAVFDIYCENEKGEKFIVEMQNNKQVFFKDRSIFYSTFPIQQQAPKGIWNFELQRVYMVGILNFPFVEDDEYPNRYRQDAQLLDKETYKIFYDKLKYIYLYMPNFKKEVDELETKFDKWLYVIKNLYKLDRMPGNMTEYVFEKLFETAEIAKLTHKEYMYYEDSLKVLRDNKNTLDYAKLEGREEGLKEGIEQGIEQGMEKGATNAKEEIAMMMLKDGDGIEKITRLTGVTTDRLIMLKSTI